MIETHVDARPKPVKGGAQFPRHVNLFFADETVETIDNLAREMARSRSWIVREAVGAYLSEHLNGNGNGDRAAA
jgi:metal-responsive CopG/Arc/MetJ family transcriptional regulator